MDAQTTKSLRRESGINVTEKPIASPAGRGNYIDNLVPILRAVLLITLLIIGGMGYSPVGCKTQYMFTDKYWYNKQIVIFLILYLVVNLRSSWQRREKEPFAVLRGTTIAFVVFNAVARMGDAWLTGPLADMGPATWFGLVLFPLVVLYILDDTRRYYKAIAGKGQYTHAINILYKTEIVLLAAICVLIAVGFFKSYSGARRKSKGKLNFWKFLFGAPIAGSKGNCRGNWPAYKRHLGGLPTKRAGWQSAVLPWAVLLAGVLLFQFILPTVNLDANQDGKLTVDDVEPGLKHIWAQTGGRVEALPHEIAKKAFEEADKDKDGAISQKEFENWVGRAPAALHTSAVAIGSI